jgi:hypothetical protein
MDQNFLLQKKERMGFNLWSMSVTRKGVLNAKVGLHVWFGFRKTTRQWA